MAQSSSMGLGDTLLIFKQWMPQQDYRNNWEENNKHLTIQSINIPAIRNRDEMIL